jgi:hypothetical protein
MRWRKETDQHEYFDVGGEVSIANVSMAMSPVGPMARAREAHDPA